MGVYSVMFVLFLFVFLFSVSFYIIECQSRDDLQGGANSDTNRKILMIKSMTLSNEEKALGPWRLLEKHLT